MTHSTQQCDYKVRLHGRHGSSHWWLVTLRSSMLLINTILVVPIPIIPIGYLYGTVKWNISQTAQGSKRLLGHNHVFFPMRISGKCYLICFRNNSILHICLDNKNSDLKTGCKMHCHTIVLCALIRKIRARPLTAMALIIWRPVGSR